MKKIFYFIMLLAIAGCEDEPVLGPSGTINLNIKPLFAGNELVLGQPYNFGTTEQIQFDELNFFVSNVKLLEEETTDETDLLEIALADFSDNAAGEAETYTFRTVPAVKYRGIKIGIGVPSSLNKSSVSGYGAGHPLKKNFDTHFWADGGSFFFMKLAGIFNAGGAATPFELFPAKNANYTTVTIFKSFELTNGETEELNLDFDILKLLQDANNQVIDFNNPNNLSTYNPENDALSALLMGTLEGAMELK
ncbi:MAG: hypothetical protein IT258_24515 [Saprospiraceae bacterium]|nr:hypothetical protein [Saprospiraceae bacterium]